MKDHKKTPIEYAMKIHACLGSKDFLEFQRLLDEEDHSFFDAVTDIAVVIAPPDEFQSMDEVAGLNQEKT